ncbi:hypothetical protein McanCB49686_004454 [Microsporum canis]
MTTTGFNANITGMQRGNVEIHSVDNLGGDGRNRMQSAASNFTTQISGLKQWQRNLHFAQHSIKGLQHSVVDGSSHKVRRGSAYKLFTILVAYSPTYQEMEEVIFDSEGLEATAVVRLQLVVGRYELNPFWSDSLGHISGLIKHSSEYSRSQALYNRRGIPNICEDAADSRRQLGIC